MKTLKGLIFKIVAIVLFLTVMLAAADNSDPVALKFLGAASWEWPVAWWVLLAFVAGMFVASVFNTWTNTRLRLAARKANKQVAKTNETLDQAKASTEVHSEVRTEPRKEVAETSV